MSDKERAFRDMQRERIIRYTSIASEQGTERARAALLDGYPERQKANMGPLITGVPLVDGFRKAQPLFESMGVRQEIVDASTDDLDAVIEINVTCMCAAAFVDAGVPDAEPILCELDFEATRRAFPGMTVTSVTRMVEGANACIFRYQRPIEHSSPPS